MSRGAIPASVVNVYTSGHIADNIPPPLAANVKELIGLSKFKV